MTDAAGDENYDLIGLSMTGGTAHFPGLATERIVACADVEPSRLEYLLAAVDTADFFTREAAPVAPVRPDARTWSVRLCLNGRSRCMTLTEPVADPVLAALLRAVRGCVPLRPVTSPATPIRADEEKPGNILDALDMPGVGDIDIEFDRPVSFPRPAAFD